MNNDNKPRSIILEIEDTKNNIIREVNNALGKGIPCYLLRSALDGVFSQLIDGAKAELEAARTHEKQLAKESEANGS